MLGVVDGSGGSARDEAARLRWGQPYTGPLCETEFRERWSIFMHIRGFVKQWRRSHGLHRSAREEACTERGYLTEQRRPCGVVAGATSSESR